MKTNQGTNKKAKLAMISRAGSYCYLKNILLTHENDILYPETKKNRIKKKVILGYFIVIIRRGRR